MILKATLKINGKLAKGKTIKFKFKGKTYSAKTNAKGIATVTIKQKVVKKLTGKSYAVKVTYLKDSIKTTVNVKQVLKAKKKQLLKNPQRNLSLKLHLRLMEKQLKVKPLNSDLMEKPTVQKPIKRE